MNSWTTEMKQYHTESLDLKTATNQASMATNKDRVMLCCNTAGNHKLNPLCISQTSSSLCFRHVNMKSLPVINESSSSAWLACDTYVSSFESESVSSVRHYLCSKEMKLYPDTHLLSRVYSVYCMNSVGTTYSNHIQLCNPILLYSEGKWNAVLFNQHGCCCWLADHENQATSAHMQPPRHLCNRKSE
jgi:hypothetical protein